MFKLDGKSLFKNQGDCSLIEELLKFRLNEGFPTGLKVLSDADKACSLAKDIAQRIGDVSKVVMLATGGSSLGGQAVCALSAYHENPSAPSVEFWENIDPREINLSLEAVDFNDTAFIATSKSGETPEILAQTAIVINKFLLSKAGRGDLLSKRFFTVTESDQSSLAKLAGQHAISVFPHPKDVGGRFSVFSIVGILPTVIAGLDASALCDGAWDVIKALQTQEAAGQNFKASICAVAQKLSEAKEGKGRSISAFVLMHYGDCLASFARWFAQLWAESLGKQGFGSTPIIACGTVDQHSQLQLYLDGPDDKLFTVLGVGNSYKDLLITGLPKDADAAFLERHGLNVVFSAARDATIEALVQKGRPLRYLEIPDLDERSLGQLMAYFILEVVITADILKIDAFNQPAVEKIKRLLRSKLSARCQ
ncbi:MAG: hypothetical protein LBJ03_03925 [Holosporales bacterium]|jgi:glucose-6-phosphate isomerase|nr:hypothetical protein [Holosporales bacterium]